MFWNRFDIVEAYYLFYANHHNGQWSPMYARLSSIQRYYRASPLGITLTENGQAIYDTLVERNTP